MNPSNTKISNHEIIQACLDDASFPSRDRFGGVHWHSSQDVQYDMPNRLILEHNFVASIRKKNELPFDISRDLDGVKLRKRTPVADRFYNLTNVPWSAVPQHHKVSELAKTFRDVANKLGIPGLNLTGNPLTVITADGLTEGEIVNAFVQRLGEATRRKTFTAAANAQSCSVARRHREFKRYVERHLDGTPNLHAMRVELQCLPASSREVGLRESAKQIENFFTALAHDLTTPVCGYWWKREHRTETGYAHHAILLCDGEKMLNEITVVQDLCQNWQTATNGQGMLFSHSYNPQNYRSWGVGSMPGAWVNAIKDLLHGVRFMLARDEYLRLTPAQSIDHVGMGVLPKPVKKMAAGYQTGHVAQQSIFTTFGNTQFAR